MKITKGTKLVVVCNRKGRYLAVATADFDTKKDEWFSVAVDQAAPVRGLTQQWEQGEEIPCRKGLVKVFHRKTQK